MRGAKPLRQRTAKVDENPVRNVTENFDVVRAPDGPAPREPSLSRELFGDGLDKRTANRLRRGKMRIEGRLDLHGYTQPDAHSAVHSFINDSKKMGQRCVLIITGKGSFRENIDLGFMPDRDIGVLRRNLPRWLSASPLREMVIHIEPARPQHGGEGAFYVLLRRKR